MAIEQTQGLPQFDFYRDKARKQFSQQKSEADEALKRRFAAQGMLQSGAYSKQQNIQEEQFGQKQQEAQSEINFAELAEKNRLKEVQEARQFQTSEREASQLFNKQLFDQDMNFKKAVQADTVRFAELDNAFREKEFGENKKTNAFNVLMAIRQQFGGSAWDQQIELSRLQETAKRFNLPTPF